MAIIKLKNTDKVIIVDDKWLDVLERFTWCIQSSGYASTNLPGGRKYRANELMHRMIMNAEKGEIIDHINRNRLDNRECNLRKCTRTNNFSHSGKRFDGLVKFKGVTYEKKRKHWVAAIHSGDKTHYLGSFDNPIKAAKAYDIAAVEIFGEYAMTNETLGLFDEPKEPVRLYLQEWFENC